MHTNDIDIITMRQNHEVCHILPTRKPYTGERIFIEL